MQISNHTPFAVEAIPFQGPDGKSFLTVVVKGTFSVSADGPVEVDSEQLPFTYGDEPYRADPNSSVRFESDLAPFKPRADIVLVGHAYAPSGQSVSGIDVSLHVGDIHKVLRVYGDRSWNTTTLLPDHPSTPQPFDKMPLIYERAFGGMDLQNGGYFRQNPVGRGFFSRLSKKSVDGALLPNIEDPGMLIHSPKDQPKPVGYGFYGRAWEPRIRYLGTYDENWSKNHAPNPPPDFQYDFYNAAHPDLQVKGYLRGNETVELINLSSEGKLNFQLPALDLSCRIHKIYSRLAAYLQSQAPDHPDIEKLNTAEPEDVELNLKLDTLCLLPDEHRFFLLWRGITPVYDLTAFEIGAVDIA